MTTIDEIEIRKRIEAGLIKTEKHPSLDLCIFNYTKRTQYDNLWDEYTRMCRGLILDSYFNIVSRPFPKFFNLNETPETLMQNLPVELPSISEKLDGVLGISYPDNEKIAISTRGSFVSEWAIWATEWLRAKGFLFEDFRPGHTYCFEIIYPGSKIVIDYGGRSELVLLAVINNSTGLELDCRKEAWELGIPAVNQYRFGNISEALEYLKTVPGDTQEGFVCKYSNGLRVKMKSDDYKRLHKVLTGLSVKDIWASLKSKQSLDPILNLVPDEFYDWVKRNVVELNAAKNHIMSHAAQVAQDASKLSTRKEQAAYVLSRASSISGVVFPLLDGKEERAELAAWDMIVPSSEVYKGDK